MFFFFYLNFKLMLFTQCLSSVGVSNFSPLNTWPRCPPQLAQQISVRTIPIVTSSCLVSAPINKHIYNHEQKSTRAIHCIYLGYYRKLCINIYIYIKCHHINTMFFLPSRVLTCWPPASTVKLCIRNIKWCITTGTMINTFCTKW